MTITRTAFLTLICLAGALTVASAQQSAKIKSKERFRERSVRSLEVRNLRNLNGAGSDQGISLYRDGLLYFSPGKANPGQAAPTSYFATFNASGTPAKASTLKLAIADKVDSLTGPVWFEPTGKRAFFTVLERPGGVPRHKIVEAAAKNGQWALASALDAINGAFHTMHPCLSADGNRLFFASDRPGGFGGFDLYVSNRENGQWQAPVNLGPAINTAANELYPNITAVGVLYFSSAGHDTQGGLDIFAVQNPLDNPQAVKNLGAPFNSPQNDFNFLPGVDGESGFFVSNRGKGAGKEDIYRFVGWRGAF